MLGAFLENYESNPNNRQHSWFDLSLISDANWLCNNNPYISNYLNSLSNQNNILTFQLQLIFQMMILLHNLDLVI